MKLFKFWTYFKLDMKLFFREPLYVIFTLLLPAIMFYIFGTMYSNDTFSGNLDYVQRFLPSQLSMILYAVGGFTLGLQIVTDKYSKAYKRLSVTPINLNMIMISIFLRGLLVVLVALIELCLMSMLMFHANLQTVQWLEFIAATLICSVMFFSLGFMIASISSKPNHALTILLILFYPMNMLSGSMFPIENLPMLFKFFSKIIPQTYTNKVLISTWTGHFYEPEMLISLGIILIFALIFIIVSRITFKWSED